MTNTKNYRFEMRGTARNGQTWETRGVLTDVGFDTTFDMALRASFEQLTEGRAIFGKPEQTCQGPYDITSITIEQVKQ